MRYQDYEKTAELRGASYPDQCRLLYEATLPLLADMATNPDQFRHLWANEDAMLADAEAAIADGRVSLTEHTDVDLAVVTIPDAVPATTGHRFGASSFGPIHPMAVNNATEAFRLLIVHGASYTYVDRYETWVQYRSRRPLPRVDMGPLAERLNVAETGSATWTSGSPATLSPEMKVSGESSLSADIVTAALLEHLAMAPPGWDPFPS